MFSEDRDPGRIFPIKVARTELVGTLKDEVKEKKSPAFDHIPADSLDLWKVHNQNGWLCCHSSAARFRFLLKIDVLCYKHVKILKRLAAPTN